VLTSKLQQELAGSPHKHNDGIVMPQGSDSEQRLFSSPKTASLTGAGDATAIGRNVASECSIESAIDSVISQARAELQTVPDLPDRLPPDLLECVNAVKDTVCCHMTSCYSS